ncbi:nodulation protein NolG [Peptoclostridium acidaminophilum DSM 3953]|uniref:Nodulation protein NolG n=1 Tax=Peptoclostridium acidaminophilum DSM 3953 TaxID=1286171 RepID=W8T1S1_PEPAC|nr:efflux RND transporter permease subunit [Peptoclostridium acidaminophilum]AHM55664.1 nodulation protein NolG [Peptoclostridium acidaminophilum DSM 3953]
MNLPSMSVKRPVTTLMFMLIAVLIGTVSLFKLPVDLYPELEVPVAIVSVDYKGVAPQEMETLVTKPLEQSLATVRDLKNISSYSREGNSIIVVEFEYGTDMDFAALEMREKVDMVKGALPDDSSAPLVLKIDPNAQPVIQIGASSNMETGELKTLVEDDILSRFERLEGVASVDISGGEETEVRIELDPEKLSGYGLSIGDIRNALRSENLNLPGGNVNNGDKELLVRTTAEFKSVDEIAELPISLRGDGVVRLSDIASVKLGYKEQTSLSRLNGKNSIGISITKQSVANTVNVAKNVLEELSRVTEDHPEIEFVVGSDQSEFINKSIDNVTSNAVAGGLLAVVVLFLFLRNIRSTFIVGIAIPISIISTFALMYFTGLTINLISLGGLALGIGMLVDNSIVVLENVYRFREQGYSKGEAAVAGAREVGMAITASTMTTIAVFLPIVFVQGFTAIIFKQLSFTVVFSLLASLVVALTVVPMMASQVLEVGEVKQRRHKGVCIGKFLDMFSRLIDSIDSKYSKLLHFVLSHRKTTVIAALGVFVASVISVAFVGGEFFPKEDQGQFTVTIETPFGTSLEDSDAYVQRIEEIVEGIPEREKVFSNVGSTEGFSLTASNSSTVNVMLVNQKDRKRSTEEIVEDVREKAQGIAGAKITVTEASSMGMGPTGSAIEIEIRGDDIDTLKAIGADIEEIVKKVPGTAEVSSSTKEGDPEVRVSIDRNRASHYGITASEAASALEASVEGVKATTLKTGSDEIDVNVSMNDRVKDSVENMKQILISSNSGTSVALGQIADIDYGNSPTQITRINQTRTVSVGSQLSGRDLKSVTDEIESKLSGYQLPAGYSYEFKGQQQDMMEAFSSLFLALLLSIVIVYMILASQFESLIHPLTVMLSVPFALSGGFLALFLTGRALSVPAFIGVIMLSGIVVNNAIVLVDYINQLRSRGMDRQDAVVKAGFTRFRPILMTTMTTLLGLLPLALGIGEGAATQAPMATVVIGGLALSTLLTLAFIPVVYTIFDDWTVKIRSFAEKVGIIRDRKGV